MSAQTLNTIARSQAKDLGDATAFATPFRRWSYRDVDEASNRVAQGLKSLGIGPGDRVATLTRHVVECLVLTIAATKLQAVCMPVNWRLAPPEIDYILGNGEARFLMADRDFADSLSRIPAATTIKNVLTEDGPPLNGLESFSAWYGQFDDVDTGYVGDTDEPALQLYSSGTTGLPKGIELSHRNLIANATNFQVEFQYYGATADKPGNVQLNALPCFHVAGIGVAIITLLHGGSQIVRDTFVPADVLQAIQDHKITHAFLVPAMIHALLMQPDIDKYDLSSLECISYGASPITDRVLTEAMQRFKCRFMQVYGLTETSGAICCLGSDDHDPNGPRSHLLRSAGKPGQGVGRRIVDTTTMKDVAEGEVGEIWIQSDQNMIGYWRNPEATAAAFPEGRKKGDFGWFRTGDAGYMRDGYLFIHDRIKDMVITGGENVYPAEVENVLMQHPAVADGAIIGVPDERWGEAVKACVTLRPGAQATPQEIIDFMRERIAHYKCPKSVDIMDALPRNPSGKLLKFVLRKPYWEGRARAVN